MIRTITQVERELNAAEAIIEHGGVEQRDNDGNVVLTAAQHRAAYVRRARGLAAELEALRRVVGSPGGGR